MLFRDNKVLWSGQHYAKAAHIIDGNKLIYYPFDSQKQSYHFLCMLSVNQQLWVGTSHGLYQIDHHNQQLKEIYSTDIFVHHLYKNDKGIWVTTDKGLFLFDQRGRLMHKYLQKDSNKHPFVIKHLNEDASDGTFWLATTEGLVHWNPDREQVLLHLTTAHGLSHNNLHAVYEDKAGYLWISSDYGLMRFHKNQEKKTYMQEGRHRFVHITFESVDGIPDSS